ncbi:MAG: bifunctional [glutamate--ammonia ligase]-adenylyl-L-tyrosine phosphorylase/[glutamate--ammonia-ligase] adenylyltransferase [Pseudomonadota bacterium]
MWSGIRQQILPRLSVAALDATLDANLDEFCSAVAAADATLADELTALVEDSRFWTLWRGLLASEFVRETILREMPFVRHFLRSPMTLPAVDAQELTDLLDREEAEAALRRFRRRHMLLIAWFDLAGLCPLDEVLERLSSLADVCLASALGIARQRMQSKHGALRDAAGEHCHLYAICMGKLGGRELNFSSDIDLVFVYSGAAISDGNRSLDASEYTLREARIVIDLLDRRTAEGRVFRVDTRLRPFGDSGPLTISFSALETYLQVHGRDWERYAFIKARFVSATLNVLPQEVVQFRRQVLQPFVYRRYLDFGVLSSLRDMKRMIGAEVARRDRGDHLKLGPGGIREIEFIVQSWQLIRGGTIATLQTHRFSAALRALGDADCIDQTTVDTLLVAYRFLRRAENCLQAFADRQTHSLPTNQIQQQSMAIVFETPDWPGFLNELNAHRHAVRIVFDDLLESTADNRGETSDTLDWFGAADGQRRTKLASLNLDSGAIQSALDPFLEACERSRLDTVARDRVNAFLENLLCGVAQRSDAVTVTERVLTIASAVLRRSAYLSLLNEQPGAMRRLLEIAAASASVTRRIALHPVLLDELLDTDEAGRAFDRDRLATRLARALEECAGEDTEERIAILVRFAQAAWFHIAVADCMGYLPIMKVSDHLSDVAELILDACLDIAWDDLVSRVGLPAGADVSNKRFAIIGYGKLGGLELGYGSDLDIVFLHDLPDGDTTGAQPIDNQRFVARLARRLVNFLGAQTGSGQLYEVDMRLRPSGRKGFLVSGLDAFERYQQQSAWTWEHQALTRARPVAGDLDIAQRFQAIRHQILTQYVQRDGLRQEVAAMRRRMREHLSQTNNEQFDLKQGRGGIADLEFIVQYLLLAHAREKPALTEWSDNIRQLDSLAGAQVITTEQASALQDAYRALRETSHRLALNGDAALIGHDELAQPRALIEKAWTQWLGQADG